MAGQLMELPAVNAFGYSNPRAGVYSLSYLLAPSACSDLATTLSRAEEFLNRCAAVATRRRARNSQPPRSERSTVEVGRRGLAGMAVRRLGHASLFAGGADDGGAVARRVRHALGPRGRVQLVDSSGVPGGLGAGRRVLRTDRRPAGTQLHAEPDDSHLCRVHRLVVFRANLVGVAHFPIRRGVGDRRGMGRRCFAALGNMAPALATLDRRGVANRREYRSAVRHGGGRVAIRLCRSDVVSRGDRPGAIGVLDSPASARDRRMACGQDFRRSPAQCAGAVRSRDSPHGGADDPGLLRYRSPPIGRSCSGSSSNCTTCPTCAIGWSPSGDDW